LDGAQAFWMGKPGRFASLLEESRTTQAQIERAEGKLQQAIETLQATVAEKRRSRSSPREEGAALNTLVLALVDAGRYEEAVSVANEALTLFTRLGVENHVVGLAAVNNRGNALVNLGRYDEAIADFRHVVELRRALYGRSPELAAAISNLAVTLSKGVSVQDADRQRTSFAEVARLLEEAYSMSKELGSETGRSLAVIRAALAQTYVRTGDIAKAEPLADEAVRIGTLHFGDKSILTGIGYRARAEVRIEQRRYADARADLADAKRVFGALGKGAEQHLASLAPLLEKVDRLAPPTLMSARAGIPRIPH
jgi:tetratricopeptide (TPR) repeat protein